MDTIKEDEMNEEETTHKTKEDRNLDDKTFSAMHIIVVQMTPGSASSTGWAQAYWNNDGVWAELGGDWWRNDDHGWWHKCHA
jgi:hypothetical protein